VSATDRIKFAWQASCKRCGLEVLVPHTGREIIRLGPCPSCDMVAWADLNDHADKALFLVGSWE